eukprot:4187252-Prymnesium_polylepis.2
MTGVRISVRQHGHTFTTVETIENVVRAIADCAFVTTDSPVVLSLEVCGTSRTRALGLTDYSVCALCATDALYAKAAAPSRADVRAALASCAAQ